MSKRDHEGLGIWYLENFVGPFLKWYLIISVAVLLLVVSIIGSSHP